MTGRKQHSDRHDGKHPQPSQSGAEKRKSDLGKSGAIKGGEFAKPGQMMGDEDKSPKDD